MIIMEVDSEGRENSKSPEITQNGISTNSILTEDDIIDYLIKCDTVYFKSQQLGEKDLTQEQKRDVATKVFDRSKSIFLSRFGEYLNEDHLSYFTNFINDENDGYEINFYLTRLKRLHSNKNKIDVRNRRYEALKNLISENTYFSETEMMKRNPLLYEQLVGQYLTEEEKRIRDNENAQNKTFVTLLLEGIDRENASERKRQQQNEEDDVMEEEDESTDDEYATPQLKLAEKKYKWGEMTEEEQPSTSNNESMLVNHTKFITAKERNLLKEEFISIMYQSFLDGKDTDFDYAAIDSNGDYDSVEKEHDEEDHYFDSESPDEVVQSVNMEADQNEEDDLDVYMQRLNQHPSVQQLTKCMEKL